MWKPPRWLYNWSLQTYGYGRLIDAFLPAFLDYYKGQKLNAPDLALQTWITRASPSGCYYNAKKWEEALEAAKSHELSGARYETSVPISRLSEAYKQSQEE